MVLGGHMNESDNSHHAMTLRPYESAHHALVELEKDPVWAQMMGCLTTHIRDHPKLMELLAR
jgi:hypothetical protein